MKYSLEKIYKDFGQFDKVVTLSFFPNSPSFTEYPEYMTGLFFYTPKEIKQMEESIQKDKSSVGLVKFKEILNELDVNKKKHLIRNGLNCEDISYVFFLPHFNQVNEFKLKETRNLPKPNVIEIDIDDNFDYDSMLVNLNKRKLSSGYQLTPEETAENIGILLNLENKNLEEIENEKKEIKILIKKYYIKSRIRHKRATEDEINELKDIENQEIATKIEILRNEIKKAGIEKKDFEKNHQIIEQVTPFLIEFTEKRLTHGTFPVWLNYERFLHIFLGHVSELNLGGNFDDKTKFQYLIDDIIRLIEIVLDTIEDEIQYHFTENNGKNFKRHGEMAVYYKGDFYVIAINPDGLLN